jgi:hypothetical protein
MAVAYRAPASATLLVNTRISGGQLVLSEQLASRRRVLSLNQTGNGSSWGNLTSVYTGQGKNNEETDAVSLNTQQQELNRIKIPSWTHAVHVQTH